MLVSSLLLTVLLLSGVDAVGLWTGPYFKDHQQVNITVHKDSPAYLPCVVKQLGDKQVSWVRAKQEDSDILTVGQYTFVNDERFSVYASPDTWTLVIKYVQARDSGQYECQISTEPKMALQFRLNVIVPQVEVIGDMEKYVRQGSSVKLECRVSSTVQLPDYIFWYHSGRRLLEAYDHRMKITVSRSENMIRHDGEMSVTSLLVIQNANLSDAGNYTCLPSNLPNSTIHLHVLDGEHPAAMQTGSSHATFPVSLSWLLVIVFVTHSLLSEVSSSKAMRWEEEDRGDKKALVFETKLTGSYNSYSYKKSNIEFEDKDKLDDSNISKKNSLKC